MAFELKLLLDSILIPAGVALAFAAVAWLLEARLPATKIASVIAIGWWSGLFAGQIAIVPWSWWSDEHWQRLLWPLLAAVLIFGPSSACCSKQPWRLLVLGTLACITAWIVIPHDDAWKDIWPEQSGWMLAIVSSVLWNHWTMEELVERGGSRWGLWILIGALSSVLVLSAFAYATMAQWVLIAMSATMGIAFLAMFRPSPWVSAIIPSLCLTIASMLAWSRFRGTFKPVWLYLLLFYSPTIIALADKLLEKRIPGWSRILLASTLSATFLIITLFESIDATHEEW